MILRSAVEVTRASTMLESRQHALLKGLNNVVRFQEPLLGFSLPATTEGEPTGDFHPKCKNPQK
jgi:hypothetical protein